MYQLCKIYGMYKMCKMYKMSKMYVKFVECVKLYIKCWKIKSNMECEKWIVPI